MTPKLIKAEAGDDYDTILLTCTDYLPDEFRIAVAKVEPASNGAECRTTEYRDAIVRAINFAILPTLTAKEMDWWFTEEPVAR